MKPLMPSDELAAMIMQVVRKRPDCSYVPNVIILPNIGAAPDYLNCKAGFTAGGRSCPRRWCSSVEQSRPDARPQ